MQPQSVEIIYHINLMAAAVAFSILVSTILVVIALAIFNANDNLVMIPVSVPLVVVLHKEVLMVAPVMVVVVVPIMVSLQVEVLAVVPDAVVPDEEILAIQVQVVQILVMNAPDHLPHQTPISLARLHTWRALLNQLTIATSSFNILLLVKSKWTLKTV